MKLVNILLREQFFIKEEKRKKKKAKQGNFSSKVDWIWLAAGLSLLFVNRTKPLMHSPPGLWRHYNKNKQRPR